MRARTETVSARRWTRSRIYALVGLGLAALSGATTVLMSAVAGGRLLQVGLWAAVGALFVAGGWLFGRQEDRLRRLSVTDPLTGLANRRELERRLAEERARARRHRQPTAVLLIDVDRLKDINDQRGHRAGDHALLAVADALRAVTRATDLPARLGGDEFELLAPETCALDASSLASRLRAELARTTADPRVTVSIGIADRSFAVPSGYDPTGVPPDDGESGSRQADALIEAADRALYRAKADGRDRVVIDAAPAGDPDRDPRWPGDHVETKRLRVIPGGRA